METALRPSRLVLAALFALVGLVWIGQGIGAIGGSVMTGSPFWAVVGAVLIVIAVAIVALERRPRPGG
jgi:glucose dehydrogenase